MKTQKGISTLTLIIYLCFIAILIGMTLKMTPGTFGAKAASDEYRKSCASQLDEALAIYYNNHSSTYPSSLAVLQTLGHIPANFPVSLFTYTTSGGYTLYRLTVTLATGTIFVSTNSKM